MSFLLDVDARVTDLADGSFHSSGGPERRRAQPKMEQGEPLSTTCHQEILVTMWEHTKGPEV